MSLRQNVSLLAVLTALIAIAAEWTDATGHCSCCGDCPQGLLLLGLAYELWWMRRADVSLVLSSNARAVLGRPMTIQFAWRHSLNRTIVIEFAPAAPSAVSIDTELRNLYVQGVIPTVDELIATPRQLGVRMYGRK